MIPVSASVADGSPCEDELPLGCEHPLGNGGYGHGIFTLRKPSALRSGEGFLALKLLGCAPLLMHLPLRKGIGRLAQLIDETAGATN